MSRELMWQCDWGSHTAKQMGIDDYDIMPERYAHRLKLRDARRGMDINQPISETTRAVAAGRQGCATGTKQHLAR
jgi:hypothetical protein